jgi:lipoprotein-anchoring transpeptidase ErfK/SrfK
MMFFPAAATVIAFPGTRGVVVPDVTNSVTRWTGWRRWAAVVGGLAVAGAAWCAVHGPAPARHTVAHGGPPAPHRFTGWFTPDAGTTVGTGMIVSVVFDRPITDRAAVRRAITVTAVPSVPVAGHWFGSRRIDFRPRGYWTPGTRVDLRLRLRGVRGAPDTLGTQSKDVVFRIGRAQRAVVDAGRHTLTVRRRGRVLRTLPVSAGDPAHATYDGLMVITEKYPVTRMNGATVGFGGQYDIADVPHAMRLTASGTFVHGNYWSPPDVFGARNISHGCIGLPDARGGDPGSPAGWFYDQSLIGDVVEVVDSPGGAVAPDNGLGGWNMSWSDWTAPSGH